MMHVKSNGGPTHYSLIKALWKIEQNTVADEIDKESKTEMVIGTIIITTLYDRASRLCYFYTM